MYYIIVSNYFATGEGNTVSILITMAYPSIDDYDENHQLKCTREEIAKREFVENAGSYYGMCAESISVEDLLKRYVNHLPPFIVRVLKEENDILPGNFNHFQQTHINFS